MTDNTARAATWRSGCGHVECAGLTACVAQRTITLTTHSVPARPSGLLREAAQVLVNMLRDRPATNLTARQWAAVEDLRAALATPDEPVAGLDQLLREAAETIHQTGSIRDHSDPNDKTGWHVKGIETCTDPLCVDLLAAAARLHEDAP